MKPLSPRKRRLYLIALVVLFFVVVPIALLYAGGWRYKAGFGLVQIGGIVVAVPLADATVTIDGDVIGQSGFFDRSFYISNLAPSSYVVQVEREGYYPWSRTLVVEPQIVTTASARLVSKETRALLIQQATTTSVSSTTRTVLAAEYNALLEAFETAATSSEVRGGQLVGMQLAVEEGNVYLRWPDGGRRFPDNFCARPSYCVDEIEVERGRPHAISAVFFADGIVYATRTGGVFFSDPDVRPTELTVPLYPHGGADVRVVDGRLIVKDDDTLYEIEGL